LKAAAGTPYHFSIMTKAEKIQFLKETFNYEANEDLKVADLDLIITGHQAPAEKAALLATIEALQEELKAKEAIANEALAKSEPDLIEVKGKKYLLQVPRFSLGSDREPVDAEALRSDPKLVAEVLAIEGQNILKPVQNA
jgi:hypothetical protein